MSYETLGDPLCPYCGTEAWESGGGVACCCCAGEPRCEPSCPKRQAAIRDHKWDGE